MNGGFIYMLCLMIFCFRLRLFKNIDIINITEIKICEKYNMINFIRFGCKGYSSVRKRNE